MKNNLRGFYIAVLMALILVDYFLPVSANSPKVQQKQSTTHNQTINQNTQQPVQLTNEPTTNKIIPNLDDHCSDKHHSPVEQGFEAESTNVLVQNNTSFAIATSSGFIYPIGTNNYATQANDGDGWYNARDFGEVNHLGEDWNAENGGNTDCGLSVRAVSNGTVVYTGYGISGWGNVLIIRHQLPDGTLVESLYGHLQSIDRTGGDVSQGEIVGRIGDGGGIYSCHLHLEIRYSNCSNWGSPGPGYKSDRSGWTDPSNFIDSHRSVRYEGYLDSANCDQIYGWAWDSTQPNTPVNVDIYDGYNYVTTVSANQFRQDLLSSGKGNGYHSFNYLTPSSLRDGQNHNIRVKISTATTDLTNSPKNLYCNYSSSKAEMLSPVSGSTFSSSTVNFSWSRGSNIYEYFLYVGNSSGTNDIYGYSQGTSQSATVYSIPTDGRTIYVRLWSRSSQGWFYNDYTYKAASSDNYNDSVKAEMLSPINGSTLYSSNATFSWSTGNAVNEYFLYLGTSFGSNDIYGSSQGTNLSTTVYGLPSNRTIYVRLWSRLNQGWVYNDYYYQRN